MIQSTFFVVASLAMSALSFPMSIQQRSTADIPTCGPEPQACICPAGSFFQASSSYAIYPVAAKEITRVTGQFLNTAWFGTSPDHVTGSSTTPGAKRFLYAGLPGGSSEYLITEQLTKFEPRTTRGRTNVGYYMKFQMADAPLTYNKTDGTQGLLAGSWDIVDVREINGQTLMLWSIYVCFGDAYDIQGFHESAMKNVTQILKQERKMRGDMIGPISF
ncbi:hypothetical protein DPSP01_013797 [Paraphaeosphaeria sporulosa]